MVREKIRMILNALGWAEAELSVTLVSDRAMARLNRETFGRPGPTNVIAFPLDAGPSLTPQADKAGVPPPPKTAGPPVVLGEVVISVETTKREAAQNGWPWEELLDFYLIHGILHLLGYQHDTPEAEAAMTAKTWELLEILQGEGEKKLTLSGSPPPS